MAKEAETRLLGSQVPTYHLVPEYEYSRGDEAIAIAEMAGLVLDPYQRDLLIDGLGCVTVPSELHKDGRLVEMWAALEVGLELSRQNGKSVIFEARVLVGLYVFREKLIVYSAHKGETALGAFGRIEELIRSNPELLAEVKKFSRTNGKEAIELWTGQVVKFRTRTAGGGRGLSGDCVILDESQDLNDGHIAALFPTLSARPNPQLWYGGSAGTQRSTVQGRLIRRAERQDARLCFSRWALGDDADPSEPKNWARVNPAVGRRMTIEFIRSEFQGMSPEKFGNERLGQGDYPRAEGDDWVIPRTNWEAAGDPDSKTSGPVVFGIEVRWARTGASISAAGYRGDQGVHFECLADEKGTLWVVDELKRLCAEHKNLGIVLNPNSPANTLVGPIKDAGLGDKLRLLKANELTEAFGEFYDGLMAEKPTYHHGGGTVLTSALADAQDRDAGGSRTWRQATSANVAPILSATWACKGLRILSAKAPPPPSPVSARGATAARSTRSSIRTTGF